MVVAALEGRCRMGRGGGRHDGLCQFIVEGHVRTAGAYIRLRSGQRGSVAPHRWTAPPLHSTCQNATHTHTHTRPPPALPVLPLPDLSDASVFFALLAGYWPGLDKKKKSIRLDCRDEQDKRENAELVIKVMAVSHHGNAPLLGLPHYNWVLCMFKREGALGRQAGSGVATTPPRAAASPRDRDRACSAPLPPRPATRTANPHPPPPVLPHEERQGLGLPH